MARPASLIIKAIFRLFSTRIGIRLFLVISLLSIIPVSVSIVMALNASKLALEGQTLNTLEAISNSMQSRLSAYLYNIEKELTVLINDPFLILQLEARTSRRGVDPDWDAGPLNNFLTENRRLLIPEAYELSIADTTGIVLTSSIPIHIGARFASTEIVEYAKTEIYMEDVFIAHEIIPESGPHVATGETAIWYLYGSVRSQPDGPAIALLMVSIDPAILSTLLQSTPEGTDDPGSPNFHRYSHSYVVNKSGLIIASTLPENDRISSTIRALDSVVERAPSDPGWHAGYLNHRGQEVIGTAGTIEMMGWMVISEIPIEISLAPYRQLQRLAITGFTLIVLIVLGIATYLTNRIIKPLHRINLAHRALGEGNADGAIIPTEEIPQDEIGDLMFSHNEMVADLDKRSGQLQTALDSGQELLALLKRPTREQDFLSPSLESLCSIVDAQVALVILEQNAAIGPSHSYFCAGDYVAENVVTGLISELADSISAVAPSELVRTHNLPESVLNDSSRKDLGAIHSFLGVPIISRSQRYGRIYLLEKSNRQAFDVDDEQRAIGFANSIALILDNMGLVEKLRDSESRYRTLYDDTPLMVFRSTIDGQLLECNPRFYELLGYSSFAELASISTAKLYYNPADRDILIKQLREKGHLENYQISLRDKQGNRKYFLNNLRISSPSDSADAVIDGILLEITAQRRAEEEKQALQAQLMEKHQTETISTMAAGLAHEFNNLLMGMMSYAELGRMSPATSPELTEYFSNIISQSKRGAALISQILAYSRQEIFTTSPTRMEELIEPAINILRGRG
ncbi:MAG: PAS domain S-box protein, partial [Candidatus Marinimicrobia bacterium]|nr:PAS domain S-box protein [Candidatus Neomarinimicrobiota bacterium]